jgi:hypothetical protein
MLVSKCCKDVMESHEFYFVCYNCWRPCEAVQLKLKEGGKNEPIRQHHDSSEKDALRG